MNKTAIAIFAHPDDECFGPGGTIALLAKKYDMYLICVSSGQAGKLPQGIDINDLDDERKNETESSAHILGIKEVFFLDFQDGFMCNNIYHKVTDKISTIVEKLKPELLITFEPKGFTGHIDHIFVSSVTSYIYERVSFIKKLLYFCITEKQRQQVSDYFVYFPSGYKESQIDQVVDCASVWDIKLRAIDAHKSQKDDARFFQPLFAASEKKEHFLILEKDNS